jgi:hypothetical protein
MVCGKIHSKTMFSAGWVALILSSLLQLVARHYPQVHPDLMDGLRGMCLGIFFGTMALTIWRNGRRAA